MLAGVLLKMGTYGISLLPAAFSGCFAPRGQVGALLAIIGIIYGALVAMVQPNLKKLVAYSSVSHLGFVVLAFLRSQHFHAGAVYQMLAHGVSTGCSLLLVGMLYDRRHTFENQRVRRPGHAHAQAGGVFPFRRAFFAGLTDAQRVRGEYLILLRDLSEALANGPRGPRSAWIPLRLLFVVVVSVFFGEITIRENRTLPDVSARERWILVTMAVVTLWMGIGSAFITRRTAAGRSGRD